MIASTVTRAARTLPVGLLAAVVLAPAPARALPPAPPSVAETRQALERLDVARRTSLNGYRREQFGGGWAGIWGARRRPARGVLIRDGRRVTVGPACRPTAGRWRSHYDGRTLRRPGGVDIDHVVPLANACRSGARRWTLERRVQFANDLQSSQLVAVSAASNRSKATAPGGVAGTRRAVWCLYGRWCIDGKMTWQLWVSPAEIRALRVMLATCSASR